MTYGFLATREESFPHAFAALSGKSAYSMGMGGYGPIQYREMVRTGLAMQPDTVVVGLYFGNDIMDAHSRAYLPTGADLRDPELKSSIASSHSTSRCRTWRSAPWKQSPTTPA